MLENQLVETEEFDQSQFAEEVLKDYRICCISREASLLSRREVLTGKAKFGITGGGKEVPQVCMARAFKKGDHRSGYYRDQTFMFASGLCTVEQFFAQLYADAINDPFSGGRQMNSHFATPYVDREGNWLPQKNMKNVSSDISCTAGQMARAVGLALASTKYRESEVLNSSTQFSDNGNEVIFCTIGDASTSEGVFWESINAAGVQQIPLLVSVWDDGYGISVPKEYQTTKGSISVVLKGFESKKKGVGIKIYKVKGWDYPSLIETYESAVVEMRKTHKPALIHVEELTQPQGHSTSGSHERYKSKKRLEWEKEHDCIKVMRSWMIENGIAKESQLEEIEKNAKTYVRDCQKRAWAAYIDPVKKDIQSTLEIYQNVIPQLPVPGKGQEIMNQLKKTLNPVLCDLVANIRRMIFLTGGLESDDIQKLKDWYAETRKMAHTRYHTHLYSDTPFSALNVPVVPAVYSESSPKKNGFEVLNAFFDMKLEEKPEVFAFGEDVGQIGDVNQGFAGLQAKYGKDRVFDAGIREWTIMGQAIGMAMRGLRPIAEIQYLDYLLYGLEPLSDDLATLRYRSDGIQAAPAIIRTRGHRLEGIWHAGSPMGMLLSSLRGMYICVPRNMTQAAGFYNTLLQSDDPGLVIECLNGYRLKEIQPDNLNEFTVPLGVPETLHEGTDITIVTYGSCVRIVMAAAEMLAGHGISAEVIDAQTLLPFDMEHHIVESLKKTNRILFVDEDVPGGATAFMMQKVMEEQKGYQYLDAQPVTLPAKAHRSPYGSDGDYFAKPNEENVFEMVYRMMNEADPVRFPDFGIS